MKNDIQEILNKAKAIDDDIREYQSFNTAKAYNLAEQRINKAERNRKITYYLFRVAAILLIPMMISTGILSYLYLNRQETYETFSYLTTEAAPGTVIQIELPDKSKVWLNAGSSLRYPSRFTENERLVFLNGEGYFDVEANPTQPFLVGLDEDIRVKAYGTQFNISSYPEDEHIETTLEEGLVDVLFNKQTVQLRPGEFISYNKEDNNASVREVNTDEKTAWKDGKLIFRNTPINDVAKRLSRRFNVDVIVHNESGKDYKFRATFTNETLVQILSYLKLAEPIEWTITDGEVQDDNTFGRQRIDLWLKK